jgi:hypothetical protein
VLSHIWQILILIGRPSENNRILFFNELTVTLYLYVLILLTDYNDSVESFEILAIILLWIVILALIFNLVVVAHNLLVFLVKLIKKMNLKLRNYCASRGKKYLE